MPYCPPAPARRVATAAMQLQGLGQPRQGKRRAALRQPRGMPWARLWQVDCMWGTDHAFEVHLGSKAAPRRLLPYFLTVFYLGTLNVLYVLYV